MTLKSKLFLTIGLTLFLILTSCTDNTITRIINNKQYSFQDNKVVQLTQDSDNITIYGMMSDTHGQVEKSRYFAKLMKEKGAEGIIVAGDIPLDEQLRYGKKDSIKDEKEIIEVLSAIADSGLPVLVIPGNHESQEEYYSAMNKLSLKYNNIIDMTKYRVLETKDCSFVSIPGYTDKRFIDQDGFFASSNIIIGSESLIKNLKSPVVLITHGPPKTQVPGPGTIYDGQNKLEDVGSEELKELQLSYNITLVVSGHIHEAGGLARSITGDSVPPNKFASQYNINFGTLEEWTYLDNITRKGRAGLIIIEQNKAKYQILELNHII